MSRICLSVALSSQKLSKSRNVRQPLCVQECVCVHVSSYAPLHLFACPALLYYVTRRLQRRLNIWCTIFRESSFTLAFKTHMMQPLSTNTTGDRATRVQPDRHCDTNNQICLCGSVCGYVSLFVHAVAVTELISVYRINSIMKRSCGSDELCALLLCSTNISGLSNQKAHLTN